MNRTSLRKSLRKSASARMLVIASTTAFTLAAAGASASAAGKQSTTAVNSLLRRSCVVFEKSPGNYSKVSGDQKIRALHIDLLAYGRAMASINPADSFERAAVIEGRSAAAEYDADLKVVLQLLKKPSTVPQARRMAVEMLDTYVSVFASARSSLEDAGLYVCPDLYNFFTYVAPADTTETTETTPPAPPATTATTTTAPPTTAVASLKPISYVDESLNVLFVPPSGQSYERESETDGLTNQYVADNTDYLSGGLTKFLYDQEGRYVATTGMYRYAKGISGVDRLSYAVSNIKEYDSKKIGEINGFQVYLGSYRSGDIIAAVRNDIYIEFYSTQSLNQKVVRDLAEFSLRRLAPTV